ncbi:hypothetical protein RZS08_45630, partial [Arthrospira platensis SPKY1]|nr:hypothetical protein [Arthrospira platensis SPKY1]
MKSFKIWSSAMESLGAVLKEAQNSKEVKAAYGTSEFFYKQALSVHRAFQGWAQEHGIDPGSLREEMRRRYKIPDPTVSMMAGAKILLTTLPNEFNVRGA